MTAAPTSPTGATIGEPDVGSVATEPPRTFCARFACGFHGDHRAGGARGVKRVGRHNLPGVAAALAAALLLVRPARASEPVAREYQVKAAFILNFAQFVEWPA